MAEGKDSLQETYTNAMEDGTDEGERGEMDNSGGHLVPPESPLSNNFYTSLSTDAAAMLW